ncbi:MAG: hypothetical protein PHY43_04630 [Verrucomicrobiales bacterium]|nr:hypothetical protein [Verrucomicrobiales bacterium]
MIRLATRYLLKWHTVRLAGLLVVYAFTAKANGMTLELGQYYSAFDSIRVTANYSNAVLAAVLPYVNDVAQRLDLPVPHPVAAEDVFHCSILPQRNLEAEIGVKGGWFFQFDHGYMRVIQGPREYFTMQDPDRIPEFFGEVKMSKAEAIQLARDTIKKLGIPLEQVFAEQEPRVTEPVHIGTNTIPHFHIEWFGPIQSLAPSVRIDVDANAKRVARISFSNNKHLERPAPKLNVPPPASRSSSWYLTNPEYARKLIPIAFQAIDEYGRKLSLPIPRPLTTNHVAKFSLADNGGWPHCEIELTNGWRFIYRNSMVNGYYAPDNLFNSDNRPILIRQFVGKQNITEQEAIDLVRNTMSKFNYPTNLVHMDFQPNFLRPALPGIPRLFIFWNTENEDDLQSKVEAEVDLDKGRLQSLYYDHKAYWNKPPPIDAPISLPEPPTTNKIPSKASASPKLPQRPFTVFKPPEK